MECIACGYLFDEGNICPSCESPARKKLREGEWVVLTDEVVEQYDHEFERVDSDPTDLFLIESIEVWNEVALCHFANLEFAFYNFDLKRADWFFTTATFKAFQGGHHE